MSNGHPVVVPGYDAYSTTYIDPLGQRVDLHTAAQRLGQVAAFSTPFTEVSRRIDTLSAELGRLEAEQAVQADLIRFLTIMADRPWEQLQEEFLRWRAADAAIQEGIKPNE